MSIPKKPSVLRLRAGSWRTTPEDADAIAFGSWTSIEEAEQRGILTAQYAVEWAAWADANGYSYRDKC